MYLAEKVFPCTLRPLLSKLRLNRARNSRKSSSESSRFHRLAPFPPGFEHFHHLLILEKAEVNKLSRDKLFHVLVVFGAFVREALEQFVYVSQREFFHVLVELLVAKDLHVNAENF